MGAFFELILQKYQLATSRYYAANMILTIERAQNKWKVPRNVLREENLMVEQIEQQAAVINKDINDQASFLNFALTHFRQINNKRMITLERISAIVKDWPYIYDYIKTSDKATQSFISFLQSEPFLNCKTIPQKTCQDLISSWISKNSSPNMNKEIFEDDQYYGSQYDFEPIDDFDLNFQFEDPFFGL